MKTNANILTNDKRTPKVAIYCRVASPDQAQFCHQQKDRLTKYAEAQGWVVQDIFMDIGTPSHSQRPAAQKMLEGCKMGRYDAVVTASISRLSRNMPDLLKIVQQLKANGVIGVFVTEQITTDSPEWDKFSAIYGQILQSERASLKHSKFREET